MSEPYCQYCHVKSSNALDHFFDKNSFPELAIFPDNLIPVCTNCNSAKRGNFVYPYFEVLRSANWLKCNVRPDGTFAFYISKDAAKNKI
ncbi:hypothetical protein [Lentilactobacillus kosonis]|uniref:hypothetical protein n=1 Tax=Lentilactobacillus kosonis TaxID=2810561 RepID=UPI000F620696|nr:hypothetical protein [Lentilactobacillus kosonis]